MTEEQAVEGIEWATNEITALRAKVASLEAAQSASNSPTTNAEAARIPAAPDVERLKGENAELRKERDALLQEPIYHAKMGSIDDGGDTPTLMTAYYWWKQAKEARAALSAIPIPAPTGECCPRDSCHKRTWCEPRFMCDHPDA